MPRYEQLDKKATIENLVTKNYDKKLWNLFRQQSFENGRFFKFADTKLFIINFEKLARKNFRGEGLKLRKILPLK